MDLQHTRINLSNLDVGRVARRHNRGHRLLHCFSLTDETFDRVVIFLALLFPEFLRIALQILAVVKVHSRFQFILRRHEVLRVKRRNVVDLQRDHIAYVLRSTRPSRKSIPAPGDRVPCVWLQRKFRVLGEQVIAQDPARVINLVLFPTADIAVFDNAAGLDVRKREGLGHNLEVLALQQRCEVNLTVEIYDRPVRTDGARPNVVDLFSLLVQRNGHVPVFPSLVGQYLDANVISFSIGLIVAIHLAVKVYSQGPGRLRVAGHF